MAGHSSFFSNIKSTWGNYSSLRNKYSDSVPIPERSYFLPIDSIPDFANLLLRPIYCPLWLGINAIMFALKALICFAATALLLIPTVVFAIFAPKSSASNEMSSVFKQMAAQTVVAATMSVIAACAAVASVLFNAIYLLTRGICTVVDRLNDVTEATLGLTIAKF